MFADYTTLYFDDCNQEFLDTHKKGIIKYT